MKGDIYIIKNSGNIGYKAFLKSPGFGKIELGEVPNEDFRFAINYNNDLVSINRIYIMDENHNITDCLDMEDYK